MQVNKFNINSKDPKRYLWWENKTISYLLTPLHANMQENSLPACSVMNK
jgi:hypothetical protein